MTQRPRKRNPRRKWIMIVALLLAAALPTLAEAAAPAVDAVYIKKPEMIRPSAGRGEKAIHPLFGAHHSVDFTFGVLPDTQFYSRSHPGIFLKMNRWFIANREVLNLRYIFHLGDIVNNDDQPYQWHTASRAMRLLDDAMLPYGIIAGNHDIGLRRDYRTYAKYFGKNRYLLNPWYGASYRNNRGHFDLIEAGGKKFIMVAMSWPVGGEDVLWINQVLALHADRTAILYVHDYLDSHGRRTAQGRMLFDRVVRPNANVRMVMNGHRFGAARRADAIDDDFDGRPDRKVLQMLCDYQSVKGGQGYIRLIGFNLVRNLVYVRTFSPQNGRTHAYEKNSDNFNFRFDLDQTDQRGDSGEKDRR
ncbi:MAG: metallophosphoesterase [Sporolactobacillus sp.]|nr:metallophosphoesterase [Sporolactobacillus sp.]